VWLTPNKYLSLNKKEFLMERIKSIVPMMAFIVCLGHLLITGVDSSKVAALLVLSALYGFIEWGVQAKGQAKLQSQMDEVIAKNLQLEKKIEEVKSNVSGIKLSQNIRQAQPLNRI
jgi:hypothetical protein